MDRDWVKKPDTVIEWSIIWAMTNILTIENAIQDTLAAPSR